MKKEIIILGDIEMGGGTLTDDFISDDALSAMIRSISKNKHQTDLVLNGDTFDFLKCPYILDGNKSFPRHISEEISLSKLDLMYTAHQLVFKALKFFTKNKNNNIYFVIGNHDHDLYFPGIQRELRRLLGNKRRVHFNLQYMQNGVYAEHGQQYDFLNSINPNRPFMKHKGKKILSIPWASFGLVSKFMSMKEEHPFLERIVPRPALFAHHKSIVKKIGVRTTKYFLKSLLYYPVRYFYDPTYTYPKELFREFYRRFKDVHWDVDKIVDKFKRKNVGLLNKHRLVVLGHIHERYLEEKGNWTIIHPDTWRDEYFLDAESKVINPKMKRYLQVLVKNNDEFSWELKDWPNNRRSWKFKDVAADELKYIKLAAKKEGFKGFIG